MRVALRAALAATLSIAVCSPSARVEARQRLDPIDVQKLAQAGERALVEGHYADAEEAYEALLRLTPGSGDIYARLGLIYFQQGKFAEAVEPLRAAIRLRPGELKLRVLLAMSLSELGQFEEAQPRLAKTFAGSGDDPVLRRMAGLHLIRVYTGLRRDREAVEAATRLSRLYPDDPEVLYHCARIFANFAYLQTIELSRIAPDSVWLHLAAGESNESLGLHDDAIRDYRNVLAAAPKRPGVHFRLARVLLERSRVSGSRADAADAQREFEAELSIDPNNANAAYELGEMARRDGNLEHARECFAAAIEQHRDFVDARIGLARVLIALGRPAEGLPHLLAAVAADPENDVAHFQLAQAYGALGNSEGQSRALAAFEQARARRGSSTSATLTPKRDTTPQSLDLATRP